MSSAPDAPTPRRGLGRGLEVLVGGAAGATTFSTCPSAPSTRTPASRGADSSPRQPRGSRRRFVTRVCSSRSSFAPGPPAGTSSSRASAAGAPPAKPVSRHCLLSSARPTTVTRSSSRWSRTSLARTCHRSKRRAPTVLSSTSSSYRSARSPSVSGGRSRRVSNRLRLLELPEEVLWMLARGELTEGHARAVLALPDDEARGPARAPRRAGRTHRQGDRARRARRRCPAPAPRNPRRPGARRAGTRSRRAAHRAPGPRLGRQARAPLRRRDEPRRARRGPRVAVGHPTGRRPNSRIRRWAILDSNQGPPPYQSGALTD